MKQNVLLCALNWVHVAALAGLVAVGLPVAPEIEVAEGLLAAEVAVAVPAAIDPQRSKAYH
jgi:hypothetical protein|tara:strand:+ start:891 stop:1073 length:183 start_codon:yes stop_codon:yes gene_type:complete